MTEFEKQKIHSEVFWSQVEKSWPDTYVADKREIVLGEKIEVCVVLCPLYSPGKLDESTLMLPPASIKDSRVANKVNAYMTTIYAMNGYLSGLGGQMHLNMVFANKGVLFAGKHGPVQEKALLHHKAVYTEAWNRFGRLNKIGIEFSDYDDWGVKFPVFVDPKATVPTDLQEVLGIKYLPESKMIAQLNTYFGKNIIDNKKNRHTVERTLSMGVDYNAAFWLIAGYLAFDDNIANIVGPTGIYIAAERFEPLFGIAKFTESLKGLTRVQLKA